ncbi:hypothetical protein AB0N87_34795 [Streptomyces sp. NPDC093228]
MVGPLISVSNGASRAVYIAPTEEAALKCGYMAIMSLDPTGKG